MKPETARFLEKSRQCLADARRLEAVVPRVAAREVATRARFVDCVAQLLALNRSIIHVASARNLEQSKTATVPRPNRTPTTGFHFAFNKLAERHTLTRSLLKQVFLPRDLSQYQSHLPSILATAEFKTGRFRSIVSQTMSSFRRS